MCILGDKESAETMINGGVFLVMAGSIRYSDAADFQLNWCILLLELRCDTNLLLCVATGSVMLDSEGATGRIGSISISKLYLGVGAKLRVELYPGLAV